VRLDCSYFTSTRSTQRSRSRHRRENSRFDASTVGIYSAILREEKSLLTGTSVAYFDPTQVICSTSYSQLTTYNISKSIPKVHVTNPCFPDLSTALEKMEIVICLCLKCNTRLGRFRNSWNGIGNTYFSPVHRPLSCEGLESTGDNYEGAQGSHVENRYTSVKSLSLDLLTIS